MPRLRLHWRPDNNSDVHRDRDQPEPEPEPEEPVELDAETKMLKRKVRCFGSGCAPAVSSVVTITETC